MERAEPGGISDNPIKTQPGPLIQSDGGPFCFSKQMKPIKKPKRKQDNERGIENGSTAE
jgi:hypothetical protein